MKMDDRLKKNPKNELLEDIRKIVKEEIGKVSIIPIISTSYSVFDFPYSDAFSITSQITGHSSF